MWRVPARLQNACRHAVLHAAAGVGKLHLGVNLRRAMGVETQQDTQPDTHVMRASQPVARERLQILLAHERLAVGQADLVSILRQEILATIARHVEFDPEKVKVQLGGAGSMSTLEIDIELPAAPMPPADRQDLPPRRSNAA